VERELVGARPPTPGRRLPAGRPAGSSTVAVMRLGVLDVGSNTVHLLVVDARRGAPPQPALSEKSVVRLAEHVDGTGALTPEGAAALTGAVALARDSASRLGCDELLAFATSAVRDARNAADVLARLRADTGVDVRVLPGTDEARLVFLAARRWFGWSAGRLLVLDVGGGSLEIACGAGEQPELAYSLPLGAGRLTRERLAGDPPPPAAVDRLRDHVDAELAAAARRVRDGDQPDLAAATSTTLRTLARLAGAAPARAGARERRTLALDTLRQVVGLVSRVPSRELGALDGVGAARAHQLLAGAVVAEAAMRALRLPVMEICPWALREGVILRRLDCLDGT
jgi:exopolyphosphatase / guanosine-5'-triphosphate,3'-diphosphate pyrophosphatase